MTLLENVFRSSLLANGIFWLVIFSYYFDQLFIFLMFLSIVPVFACCAVVITTTIHPFFNLIIKDKADRSYKIYFPFYSCLMFLLCLYWIKRIEDPIALAFFSSCFFTTCQSWLWFAHAKKDGNKNLKTSKK